MIKPKWFKQSVVYVAALGLNSAVLAVGEVDDSAVDKKSDLEKKNSAFVMEEVIVTATKRETSLQKTALSVSAIPEDLLEKLGITAFDQILATVPGATVLDNGPGNTRVSFRGVASNATLVGNATTGTYIDEFPLGLGDIDVKLVDIAQVEVLKGPQGTLYGQSAMGGVMRFITNKPSFDAVSGGFEGSASSVASGDAGYRGQGYLNIPIADNIAIRAVLYDIETPGFIDNLGTGTEDVNKEETTGGRMTLRWAFSENSEFNLFYLRQEQDLGGGQGVGFQTASSTYTPVQDNSVPTDIIPPDLSAPAYVSNVDAVMERDAEVLNIKWDIGFKSFDLSLMAATKELKSNRINDSAPWIGLYDDVTVLLVKDASDKDADTFEVRLVSTGDGPLDWIVGSWYEKTDRFNRYGSVLQTTRDDVRVFGCCDLVDGDVLEDRSIRKNSKELAFYGELGYRLTDVAKLTLGYRRADIELDPALLTANGSFDNGGAIGVDESVQEDVDTYKIHFEYALSEDALVYALAASGYRAGGYNRGGLRGGATTQYESDSIWNYEVGVRSSWMDNRLIANAVAYHIDWSDIQLRTWDVEQSRQNIQNVGEAEIYGLETEISYQVSEGIRLSLSYSHIDAALAEDFLNARTTPPTVIAAEGDRLPGSAKDSVSLFVDWQTQLTSNLDLLVSANYVYVGSRPNQFGTVRPSGLPDDRTISSLQTVNLNAGVSHESGLTVSLFASNLFDERETQLISGYAAGATLESYTLNRPRTIGVRAGYKF
jgi:iron complex outermembrane recepter protein